MLRYAIRALWLVLVVSLLLPLAVLVVAGPEPRWLRAATVVPLLCGALALATLTAAGLALGRRLRQFLHALLQNDYQSGMPPSFWTQTELGRFERQLNRLADHLRAYDELQTSAVRTNYRALDQVLRTATEAIILAEVEQRQFLLNPAAQAQFGVQHATFSFAALAGLPENAEFMALVNETITSQKLPREATVQVALPARDCQQRLTLRITPIKDAAEDVCKLVIVLAPRPGPTTPPP